MQNIHIKLIPGDGVGPEVIHEGKKILKKIEDIHGGIRFEFDSLDWGCEYYLTHQEMMPKDGLSILSDCDAILLGAIGYPGVPDHISLHGLLFPVRKEFDQYINFRPVKLLEGFESPLKISKPEDIDFVVIRENTEGEYSGKGQILYENTTNEVVIQAAWFSRIGTYRIIKYAFEYAAQHEMKSVTSATKSNALNYSMVFWDKIFNEIKPGYPNIEAKSNHIDALAGLFILKPQTLDVVVASNLFGDILSDLGSAMLGSIGISPAANINPEKKYPSLFEPIHGSAPDITGKGIANPIGTIWSIALMLNHLGLTEMEALLMSAMARTVKEQKFRTPDMGGNSTTTEVAEEIGRKLEM